MLACKLEENTHDLNSNSSVKTLSLPKKIKRDTKKRQAFFSFSILSDCSL